MILILIKVIPKKPKKKNLINKQIQKSKKNLKLSQNSNKIINFNNCSDDPNRTYNTKSKLNLESKYYLMDDIIPPNTYNFPLEEERNININIKGDSNVIDDNLKIYSNEIEAMSIFFEYIHLIIYYETRTEHLRESLSLRDDLTPKEIFYLFDKDKYKYITIDNFVLICKNVFKIYPTNAHTKLLFKRYKRDLNLKSKNNQDFSLNQNEFFQMLIPKKRNLFSIPSNKNNNNKAKSKLSNKSKNILVELIKCLIIKESNYYKTRFQLEQKGLELIWKEMYKFSNYEQSIGKSELNKFFVEYGYIFGKKQLEIIFNFFDKDNKGLINDNDFFEEMCSE